MGGPNYVGDVVRSEYEQELVIAELAAKEEMERRIKTGRCDIPRQIAEIESYTTVQFIDTQNHRLVLDPLLEEEQNKNSNPWSNVEKCIFLDRWLQYPKNFRKIASFLRNKSTRDCVRFYYDSKMSIPYKAALKEHWIRRKKRHGEAWKRTIEAVESVGAEVVGENDDGSPQFVLPSNDNDYSTRCLHPKTAEVFQAFHELEKLKQCQSPVQGMSRSVSQDSVLSIGSKRQYDVSEAEDKSSKTLESLSSRDPRKNGTTS